MSKEPTAEKTANYSDTLPCVDTGYITINDMTRWTCVKEEYKKEYKGYLIEYLKKQGYKDGFDMVNIIGGFSQFATEYAITKMYDNRISEYQKKIEKQKEIIVELTEMSKVAKVN